MPFGAYKTHYFPEDELRYFAHKAQSAVFLCADFQQTFELADKHSVIYCDPPYAPLPQDTNFTGYAGNAFGLEHQKNLAECAKKSTKKKKQISVVILITIRNLRVRFIKGLNLNALKVQRFN